MTADSHPTRSASPVPDLGHLRALDARLENWGRVMRTAGLRFDPIANGFVGVITCHHGDWYRSPQPWHALPTARPASNVLDAMEVEQAVCALDVFFHLILKGWYVRKWHPGKIMRVAQRASGEARKYAFNGALDRALALLDAQLQRDGKFFVPRGSNLTQTNEKDVQ